MSKVAIIGGGSSGISALYQLLSLGFDATVYEAAAEIGGAWVINHGPGECVVEFDKTGQAWANGETTTAMYPGLRTNVPSLVMEYRNASFHHKEGLFPNSDGVLNYLKEYVATYKLDQFIRVNSRVTQLRYTKPEDGGEQRKWLVSVNGKDADQVDFVVVANGHYTKPFFPYVDGLSTFTGKILHSKWYRDARLYASQDTLVIGNGASGYDISREIAGEIAAHATGGKIYQSQKSAAKALFEVDANDTKNRTWYDTIDRRPPVRKISGKTIEFEDGSVVSDVDLIIYATGYYFSNDFALVNNSPFQENPLTVFDGAPSTHGRRLHHLDERQLFYLPDPSLIVLAINYAIIPFPVSEIQARLAGLYWAKLLALEFKEGIPESAPEDLALHLRGSEEDYNYQDKIAVEIQGAADDLERVTKTAQEALSQKLNIAWPDYITFTTVPQARRELRDGSKGLRRDIIGY